MPELSIYFNQVLFAILPYVSVFLFFFVTIQRYRLQKFTYSSLSSQFLENKHHFWGLVPFHYGLIVVLIGHIIAFLVPRKVLIFNSVPLRLYILEAAALVCGLLTLIGLIAILIRRTNDSKLKVVTSTSDWIVYLLLLIQVAGGVYIAIFNPWGSSWFAATMAPYLMSLVKLNPEIAYVTALPFMVKLHIINAFLLIGFFPFTRLVHILVVPNPYLWRKTQVVRWYKH